MATVDENASEPSASCYHWATEVALVVAAAFTAILLFTVDFEKDMEAIAWGVGVFGGLQLGRLTLSVWLYNYGSGKASVLGSKVPPMSYKDLYQARRRSSETLLAVSGTTLAFIAFLSSASLERSVLAGVFIFTVVSVLFYETLLQTAEGLVNSDTAEDLGALREVEWLASRLPQWSFVLSLSLLVVAVMLQKLN